MSFIKSVQRPASMLKQLLPLIRVSAMLLQVAVTIVLLGIAAVPSGLLMREMMARFGIVGASLALPFAYAVWGLAFCAMVIAAKRTVFRVTPVGSFPFYSTTVVRWAFVTQLAEVAHQMFISWVIGTDLVAWWFGLLGARIGRRVTINTVFIYDWDLLDIGDDCFIGGRSTVMAHIGQGSRVTFAPTRLGSQCTVGQDSCVFCGVVMENRAVLGANSLALRNQKLLANTKYLGVPAERVAALGGNSQSESAKEAGNFRSSGVCTPVFLDRNENHFPAADACMDVLANVSAETITSYSRVELLADRLSLWLGVERNRIALGGGAESVLKTAFHSLTEPGDTVLLPSHSWSYYDDLASETNCRASYYPLEQRGDLFHTSPKTILRAAKNSAARLVLIASPNNPTGNSIDLVDLRTVLHSLGDASVILDEAYWGYTSRSNAHVAELVEEFPNLLIVRSFSKFFGMPGLRMGFGVAGSGLKPFVRRSWAYLGYNRVAEQVAVAALDNISHFEAIADVVAREKKTLVDSLGKIEGVRCYRSEGNFILVRLPERLAYTFKAHAEAIGVHVKHFMAGALANCVRITIGTPEENARVIRAFEDVREAAA